MNGLNAITLIDNKIFEDLLIFIFIIRKNALIFKMMEAGINVQIT
jgi:hypothetical protein